MKKGFTIVELTAIIVILGILAGITIVGYGAWRDRLVVTSLKNDLLAANTAMKGAQDRDTGFPTTLPSAFEPSSGITVILKPGSTPVFYCLEATSIEKPGVTYFLDNDKNKEPKEGTCVMPYSPPATPAAVTGISHGYAFAVSPTIDYAYYSNNMTGTSAIRRVPLLGGSSEAVIANPGVGAIRAMAFDSTGKLYVSAGNTVYRVDVEAKTSTQVVTGIAATAYSLFLDGDDTLYIGGSTAFYRYTISSNTLTTLYTGSTYNYFGIAKVGNYLYLLKGANGMARFDLTSSQMTVTYTTPPLNSNVGSMIELNGKLYMTLSASLYVFDPVTAEWDTVVSNARPASCSNALSIGKRAQYVLYFGRVDTTQTSCTAPAGGYAIQVVTP